MGRRKITIQQITDPKLRNITYNKRKNGLIKKAAEIALLCDINLMLVFEDLNGNLVQFSRNKIKSIASFPKTCNFKRVVELTAEDYPDFPKIKRHKKVPEMSDMGSCVTPSTTKENARSLMQMFSEHESMMSPDGDDDDSSQTDGKMDYISIYNTISESPEHYNNIGFSEAGTLGDGSPSPNLKLQPDLIKKALKKSSTVPLPSSGKRPSANKESKNKLGLRLNIPKADESKNGPKNARKDSLQSSQKLNSSQKQNSAQKQNSSQKSYARNFMPVAPTNNNNNNGSSKVSDKKMDFTQSPYQFVGVDGHNQYNMTNRNNISIVNMMNSPYKDQLFQQRNFEDNIGSNFSAEFSPFNIPMIGLTPPTMIQKDGRMAQEDAFSSEKIVNYLSHPGRSPPQQDNVFTFQQAEYQRALENNMMYNNQQQNLSMEGEGSTKKVSYWELQHSNGRLDSGNSQQHNVYSGYGSHGTHSGNRYGFMGYYFNDDRMNDYNEAMGRMKLS